MYRVMGREFIAWAGLSDQAGFDPDVLLLDNCEGTFSWVATGTGGGDTHEFALQAALGGRYGLQLKTRVGGAMAGDWLVGTRVFGYPERGLLVARLRMAGYMLATVGQMGFELGAADGTRLWQASLVVQPNVPSCSYLNALGGLTAIAGLGYSPGELSWTTLELVIDLVTHRYVEAGWSGARVGLGGVALRDGGVDTSRWASLGARVETSGAAAAEVFFDNVYVGELRDR